jgi:NAD(P)H-dependent FMN reductase
VITPEYNHSIPGVLKNAIDNVFLSDAMRNKPIAAIGYSTGQAAGIRAIEHLALIAIELEAAPIRSSVPIASIMSAFGPDGTPTDPLTDVALTIALDDLAWWSTALAEARSRGELKPGKLRFIAARTKLAGS